MVETWDEYKGIIIYLVYIGEQKNPNYILEHRMFEYSGINLQSNWLSKIRSIGCDDGIVQLRRGQSSLRWHSLGPKWAEKHKETKEKCKKRKWTDQWRDHLWKDQIS